MTLRRLLIRVPDFLWALALLLLPLTSLPLLGQVGGSTMVSPPSLVPVVLLAGIWLLPGLLKSLALPGQVKPLLLFMALALLSSLFSYFLFLPLFRQADSTRQMLSAGVTLTLGVCAYLLALSFPAKSALLERSLRWINWGGVIMLAWSFTQAAIYRYPEGYPLWMQNVQEIISSARLYPGRVTALAYEPSWLAHQLNMLYLPLWLASTVRGYTAHRQRVFGISFENVLLVGGLAILWLSLSRVGLLAFLLMVSWLLLKANRWLVGWLQSRLERRFTRPSGQTRTFRRWLAVGLILALLVIYLAMFLGAALLLNRFDPRMAQLFNFTAFHEGGFLWYANQIMFAERVVFWQTGWEVFNDHPLLGVGLGNSGYYFPQKLPAFGWGLGEVNFLIFHQTNLPNTKSLWVRLLAETGLVGFACFAVWLVLGWLTAGALDQSREKLWRMFGLTGQFVVLGLLVEGFSIDSFALPYFWISSGLVLAAWKISIQPVSMATQAAKDRVESS